jgi:hypothetical protein
MGKLFRKLLQEPLVHFLMLGAAIFLAYTSLSKHFSNEPGKIIITQGQIASMRDAFTTVRQRQPSAEELDGMIHDRVREEIYYQEALALGLDKDDIIIRRRLQQKMEFIANDVTIQPSPSDAELSDFMMKHPELFHQETKFSFRQVYLNPQLRGNNLKKDASGLLSELNKTNAKDKFRKMGDASLLPPEMLDVSSSEVTNQFGEEFTKQLSQLPVGRWIGPVTSTYGVHILYVGKQTEEGAPVLADIHDVVLREWDVAFQQQANEKFYQELLKNYKVVIEKPEKATVKYDASLLK